MPADALVYMEASDLGAAVRAIVEKESFRNAAKSVPDVTALDGVKMAIAVTGFETTEEQAGEGGQAVLNFQPRFVAVAETNTWNSYAISFTENQIGQFISDAYGGVELERFPRHDGTYFVWTAQDGRKAFGLVLGSLIMFGNDEPALERCIAVKKGEAPSIATIGKLPAGEMLASGFVSPDGAAQIANLASVQLAIGTGEEEDVRSFVAGVLPGILRNTLKEMTWTSRRTEQGIEDAYAITAAPEIAKVLNETLQPTGAADASLLGYIPAEVTSATRYDLRDPQIAWRSVLLAAQQQTDAVSGGIIGVFAQTFFEPYGVEQPEEFLSAAGSTILTIRFDAEGEDVVAVTTAKDAEKMKLAMAKEFKFAAKPEELSGALVWKSEGGEQAFAVRGAHVLVGDTESVLRCLAAAASQNAPAGFIERFNAAGTRAASVTVASDVDADAALVRVLADRKSDTEPVVQQFRISTSFTATGINRTEVSDFGLIGSVVEQFAKE